MHYRMLVTMNKEQAAISSEARNYVFEELQSDDTFIGGGRFHLGHCDWFVIGGRWSGTLSRASWARDVQAEIDQLQKEEGLRVWGAFYADPVKRKQQADLKARVEKLYEQAMPAAYREKGLVYDRDTYLDHGYEDDAMLLSEALYLALLADYEGEALVTEEFEVTFIDFDYEPLSREFVGNKSRRGWSSMHTHRQRIISMPQQKEHKEKTYPIYRQEDKDLPPGLYLALFHGFEDEQARQAHNDAGGGWGANGPAIGPLRFVHTTYVCHIKLAFMESERAALYGLDVGFPDLKVNPESECVLFRGMEYGDWTVYIIQED